MRENGAAGWRRHDRPRTPPPDTRFFESEQGADKNRASQKPQNSSVTARSPAQCEGPRKAQTKWSALTAGNSLIPEPVMRPRPADGDVAFYHGFGAPRRDPDAHINVHDKRRNGNQRRGRVNKDCDGKQPVDLAGNSLRVPDDDSSHQPDKVAVEHDPPELLLSGIEALLRRHDFIVVLDVGLHVLVPLLILWNRLHVAFPLAVHPPDGKRVDQSDPWMQPTHGSRTAHDVRQPI